jgi:predicted translin family RNA/ssDNA-binding protein
MLQQSEIEQRYRHLQQTIGEAEQACRATQDAPNEVRDCIEKLARESRQAQDVMQSKDQQRITQCVDNLEAMGDEVKRLSRSSSSMPAHLESVVTRVHSELSEFKHKLH